MPIASACKHGIVPGLVLRRAAGLDAVFSVGPADDPDHSGLIIDGDVAHGPAGGAEAGKESSE